MRIKFRALSQCWITYYMPDNFFIRGKINLRLFTKQRAISTPILVIVLGAVLLVGGLTALYFTGFSPFSRTITEEKDFRDFKTVKVGNAFRVEIIKSSSYSISIIADSNIIDDIEVFKTGDVLTIRIAPPKEYQVIQARTLRAEITMPDLYGLELSGATHGTVKGFSSTLKLVLIVSGASSLDLTDMSAGEVEAEVSGASDVEGNLMASGDAQFTVLGASSLKLDGEANNLVVDECSGASSMDLSNFPVNDASVDLSGASQGTVNLDGRLDANISGASRLEYIGEPIMGDINIYDSSSISKK